METNTKWAAAIIIILLLVGGFGYYTDWTWKLEELPYEPEVGEWLGGTFDLTVKGRNSLDSSDTSIVVTTYFTGDWWAYRKGSWVFLGGGSATGTEIESEPGDNGYIWLLVEEVSGKYYYADVPYTIAKNTYITESKWVDADGDTDKEYLYKVSLWNIPEPASDYPARTFYPYFLEESGAGTGADALSWVACGEVADGSISNITVSTSSTETKYIGWETRLSTTEAGGSKKAIGIYKIKITVNTTDTALYELDKVNIPGVGYLDGSQFAEQTIGTTSTTYTYTIGNDYNNIVYWKIPAGTANKMDNTVAIKFPGGLAEGRLGFTLTIYVWMSDRSSVSSDTDTVYCVATA